ncbi:hypothetical protein K505DRAFT_353067 [Melanomma pulvis-pyrius CBS 109.77]|uniref:Uncharacterized protein n=1 Tax=Melanomma pulvis-pyrius CBS 109.77 TaxID=1314802 RepID=A0A6A6WXK5_9PLEO|nr:hypothetical protein K505DRAFT_353067 [Melanomma pulvis-pyrius CBS 109.77]
MDPLSVTAGIIAYLNDVKDALKGRTHLLYRLKDYYLTVQDLAIKNGPLNQFKQALETLQSKITDRGRLQKVGEALRLKSLVEIALQIDHFKLSQAIKDDTNFIRTHIPVIQSGISPTDYPAQQSDIIKRRQEGTGQYRNHSLLKLVQSSLHGVAYDASRMLAAILKQLVQARLSLVEPVERLHKQHASRGTRPSPDKFLAKLCDLQAGRDIRLMATLRFIPEIASKEDVKQFVASRICQLPKCIQRDPALQEIV